MCCGSSAAPTRSTAISKLNTRRSQTGYGFFDQDKTKRPRAGEILQFSETFIQSGHLQVFANALRAGRNSATVSHSYFRQHHECSEARFAFPFLTRKHVGMRRMRKDKVLIFAATTIFASPVCAETCPDRIAEASRLVLVTTRSMDTQLANMQLFTRQSANNPWKQVGAAEPAVVGKAGLGWGYSFVDLKDREEPEKVEGDKRTPAGFFRIGASFGFAPSRRPGYIELKGGETVCVEDPTSPFYNTITKRSEIGSVEADDMRSSPFYRSGLFVDYPSDRATQRGSCILIHIWGAPDTGTAGCIGLPEERVRALQDFSRPGAVLAVLPETALARFPGCLPATTLRTPALTSANR